MRALDRASCIDTGHHSDVVPIRAIRVLVLEKKLCPNCNKEVVHDPADCFSLEANKDKCPKGWGTKHGN